MIAMFHFAVLVAATIFAAALAVACNWLLLRVTFRLMQPAAVSKTSTRSELRSGNIRLPRVLASNR